MTLKMRKNACVILILILLGNQIYAQSDDGMNVTAEIRLITDVPYLPELSGDSTYWNLVIQGKSIVPSLIKDIANTQPTLIPIPNYGKNYCIGDIAFSILCDIIHGIPIIDFILNKKDYPTTEDDTYLSFVNYNKRNRSYLKRQLKQWYKANEENLIWVTDTLPKKTSANWPFALKQNPAQGYYKVSQ